MDCLGMYLKKHESFVTVNSNYDVNFFLLNKEFPYTHNLQ